MMEGCRPGGRMILGRIVSLTLLGVVFFLMCAPIASVSEQGGESHTSVPVANQGSPGASSNSQAKPAPDAPRWPFLRLVVVLSSGLAISAARLARKFRRFLGLGVFTNPYAVLFLTFGIAVCGIPVTSRGVLRAIPHLGSLG